MKKSIFIILILLLTICLSCCFFACNKGGESDTRKMAVLNFQNSYMKVCDKNWTYNLEDTKKLPNEGHFIYQKAVCEIYSEAFYNSNIREQKIDALSNKILADEIIQSVQDDTLNTKQILKLIDDAGFTSQDISNVILAIFKSYVDNGYTKFKNVIDVLEKKIDILEGEKDSTNFEKHDEIVLVKIKANQLLDSLKPLNENANELNNTIVEIGDSFSTLISFVYNTGISIMNLNDMKVLIDFKNITSRDSEMVTTYFQGILSVISGLKNELTDKEILNLSNGLEKIKVAMKDIYVGGGIFNKIRNVINVSSSAVSVLSIACDILLSVKDIVSIKYVDDFLNVYGNNLIKENYALLFGYAISFFMEKNSRDSFKHKISDMVEKCKLDAIGYVGYILDAIISNLQLDHDKTHYLSSNDVELLASYISYQILKNGHMANVQEFLRMYELNHNTDFVITNAVSWGNKLRENVLNTTLNPKKAGKDKLLYIERLENNDKTPKRENVREWFDKIILSYDSFLSDREEYIKGQLKKTVSKLLDEFYKPENKTIYENLKKAYHQTHIPLIETSENIDEIKQWHIDGNIDFIINMFKLDQNNG